MMTECSVLIKVDQPVEMCLPIHHSVCSMKPDFSRVSAEPPVRCCWTAPAGIHKAGPCALLRLEVISVRRAAACRLQEEVLELSEEDQRDRSPGEAQEKPELLGSDPEV
ncbi:hypothetical protein XENOCAPTIV_021087 [Xenoophorus captivus]|uniref:Uncharacterized protein n=1 Tax=Xenoophorus captivus TaxID=1517983 RepID=A0ABV0RTH2_9TELE